MDAFLALGPDVLACVGEWLDDESIMAWTVASTSARQVFAWHAACVRIRPDLLARQRKFRHSFSYNFHQLMVMRALLVLCNCDRVQDLRDEVEAQTNRGSRMIVALARPSLYMQLRRFVKVVENANYDWCMSVLSRLQLCHGYVCNAALCREW